ncbi:hypothetical protein GOP47_0012459 [Adiantum capillus-veneris]|uniref:NAC domain-containing protein n=1 Tax=Adiantum capillus-veneris TaxID=13818 RepID=A0A9D4ZEB8_ADICA|nr:hypothetical protein GOP47_0012459 [Adiantum capillus-veneris]
MREEEEVVAGTRRSLVPPGFRFHPTDEELVDFYLRNKLGRAKFDLDHVIPEVDLNKLEPWDLREKCKVDASHQSTEWYFFSHKDKKYPTGTRTNRATKAGFWKATGRDKAVIMSSISQSQHLAAGQRIGMRKTLVFYKGRAPHGMKTDWIMHEYRLQDGDYINHLPKISNEDGWVVCRVFKKKNYEEKSSSTRTSSYDHSNSNLSDEEPSPIKSTYSNISKTDVASPHSAMSTFKSSQKPLKIKEGEVINGPMSPAMKLGSINLALFSCKQEMMGDHYYEGLSINNQPTPSTFYQLPYLESTELLAPYYNNIVGGSTIATMSPIANVGENQAKRLDISNQKLHQLNNFESTHQEHLGAMVSKCASKSMCLNEEDLAHYLEAHISSNGQSLPDNLQGWSLYENLARLQGTTEAVAAASFANDQLFPHFNNAHLSKVQQPLENYSSSCEIELWNFPR